MIASELFVEPKKPAEAQLTDSTDGSQDPNENPAPAAAADKEDDFWVASWAIIDGFCPSLKEDVFAKLGRPLSPSVEKPVLPPMPSPVPMEAQADPAYQTPPEPQYLNINVDPNATATIPSVTLDPSVPAPDYAYPVPSEQLLNYTQQQYPPIVTPTSPPLFQPITTPQNLSSSANLPAYQPPSTTSTQLQPGDSVINFDAPIPFDSSNSSGGDFLYNHTNSPPLSSHIPTS